MMLKLQYGNKTILNSARTGYVGFVPPAPEPVVIVPSDMDFIYFANSFDGSKIPNSAPNSTFGDYLKQGTLTLNGSGAAAYLSNGLSDSNYLYKDLTTTELNNIKAVNNTYTFFIRVMQDQSALGGIVSTRINESNTYIYMIRAENYQLQLHTTSGYNCGSDFRLDTDRVYKVVINGSSFKAYNLDNNAEYSLTYSTNRQMANRMMSFNAYSASSYGESKLSRFYALAGIPRATTAEEDANIKYALMNQTILGA
jgi:hypothetical protein